MDIGSVIYVKGHLNSLADDAIKMSETLEDYTPFRTNYTHIAIYIGNGQVAEAQGDRLSGPAPLSTYAGNYDVGNFDWTPEQQKEIVRVAESLYGLKYNWVEIAEIGIEDLTGIELPECNLPQFICSEYVKQIIKEATGVVVCDKKFTTPEDISLYPRQRITSG